MSMAMAQRFMLACICTFPAAFPPGAADAGASPEAAAQARQILESSGVKGGLIVHLGCGDGTLTAALRASERYLVHGLEGDGSRVARARAYVESLGLYGPVSVDRLAGSQLPYVDNLVNLVVASGKCQVASEEIARVLAPGGVLLAMGDSLDTRHSTLDTRPLTQPKGWVRAVKPRPKTMDEWTHWLHGPDGNAVAADTAVGPPRRAQWIAEPRWQRHHEMPPSINAIVSAGGRLFTIVNEAAPGIDGLPDRWALVARDAFNGKLLWKRPMPEWGPAQWSNRSYGHGRWNQPTQIPRRLVAAKGRVYVTLGFNAPLTALDAATGRTVMTYPQSRFTDEILYHEGTLVLAVNHAAQAPGRIKAAPPVKKSVVALDAPTGKALWKTDGFVGAASKADAIERITHLTMVLGGGKVYVIEEDAVVALSLKTGERVWRKERPDRPRPVTYGSYYFTNLCSLVYHDGMVLFIEPQANTKRTPWNAPAKGEMLGMSADTGKVAWRRPCGIWGHYNPGDLLVIDGVAWVHDGQDFSMLGIDPRTGKVKRTLSTKEALDQGHHHRCYRNKATTRYILTGRRGVEFIDLGSSENLRHHWVRGTCRYGILPCNGLLYAPPHPCVCYITAKLNGFLALAPSGEGRGKRDEGRAESHPRIERGPAYAAIGNRQSEIGNPTDWPTYRHDAARSGSAGTRIAGALRPAWETPLGGRLSSPVIAEGKVLVASPDTHTIWALGAADGKPAWRYTAGGRVDTPPTVHRGLALFGSADGWVYCLRLADGKLAWRLRAAPEERRMMNRDRLESAWPVHGSVLVRDGVACFAAGRSSFLDGGIHVYAVAPETGKVLQQRRIDSLDPKTGDMVKCRLPYDMPPDALGALPDVLVGDGTGIYMRHLRFSPDDLAWRSAAAPPDGKKRRRTFPSVGGHLMSVAGLLDDAWFNQTYWTVDGKSHSKLLVFDAKAAYGVKPFPGNARHSRPVFRPGTGGYTLFANQRPDHRARWSRKVPVRVIAMVVAGPTLFIAGPPDVVPRDDPWAAMEGRKGGALWAVSAADGKTLAEHKLDSPPVFDGMAAAGGRLHLATVRGTVLCLSGQE